MMDPLFCMAAAAAGDGPSTLGGINPLILIGGMIAVFWFLIIAPQRKRDRQRRETMDNLRRNDRVVTSGGVHGVIVSLKDDEVILKVDPAKDVTLKLSRSSISRVLGSADDEDA